MMGEIERTEQAARAALLLINWDGDDPHPVVGLIYAIVSELEAVGHSRESMSEMLTVMGACWAAADAA